MYPYHWTWTYTIIFAVSLLAVFLTTGAVLLLRRSSVIRNLPIHGQNHKQCSVPASTKAVSPIGNNEPALPSQPGVNSDVTHRTTDLFFPEQAKAEMGEESICSSYGTVRRTPESISTPLGCGAGDWQRTRERQVDDLPTQPYVPVASPWQFQANPERLEQGIARARERDTYHMKGKQ